MCSEKEKAFDFISKSTKTTSLFKMDAAHHFYFFLKEGEGIRPLSKEFDVVLLLFIREILRAFLFCCVNKGCVKAFMLCKETAMK